MPNYPKVERAAVDGFLKVYNRGGLHLLFDNTSRQAMVDFSNIVLKSYVDDLIAKANAAKKAKEAKSLDPKPEGIKTPSAPQSIILTD